LIPPAVNSPAAGTSIRQKAELAARRIEDVTTVVMDIDVTGIGTPPQSAGDIARLIRVV